MGETQLRGLPSTWNPLHSDGPRASQTPIISAVMPQYFHFSARAEPAVHDLRQLLMHHAGVLWTLVS